MLSAEGKPEGWNGEPRRPTHTWVYRTELSLKAARKGRISPQTIQGTVVIYVEEKLKLDPRRGKNASKQDGEPCWEHGGRRT